VLIRYPDFDFTQPLSFKDGKVKASVFPTYGSSEWKLPVQKQDILPTHPQFFRILSKLFLEGQIFSEMKKYKYDINPN
jgi:hypothetical protein